MKPKFSSRFLSGAAYVFFVLILATPFVWSNEFVDSVLTPKLIWFALCTSVFVTAIFFNFLVSESNFKLRINGIDICVLGFFIYMHINHFFTDISYISAKISISTATIIGYIFLRSKMHQKSVDTMISLFIPLPFIAATITSIIALYQHVLMISFGEGMGMTVAMGNSGAVSSYLSLLFPWMLLYVNASKKSSILYLYRIAIALTLIALFFTQARAAWLAVIVSSLFVLMIQYRSKIKGVFKKNSKASFLFIILSLSILLLGSFGIYHLKKDSANGRLFIWKRTLELISDHPITGVGFNKFGSVYPEYQAAYLQSHPNDPAQFLANDINHAFNEYLQFTAELGIVGFMLFGSILYFLFVAFRNRKKQINDILLACYGGIISFFVLSWFTYPFKIFSVQFLLFCFIAIIASQTSIKELYSISKKSVLLISASLCIVMLFVSSSELKRYQREKSWQQVYELRNDLNWKTRARAFNELYESNSANWDFLSVYGIELTINEEHKKAIQVLQQATRYMKTSELYTHLGISFEETGDYERSREAYEMAINMVPHKFFPRYRLVYLYKKMGLNEEALNLAKKMVITPTKVNSKIVEGIKYDMKKFIKQNSYE